jgi:4-hydroxybenzoate polyprenyltransferase
LAGTLLSLQLAPPAVTFGLTAYFTLNLAYSLFLKRFPLVDVLVLATLFTLRLGIGAAAAGVLLSPWLLTFSMFLFLSLSLAKRCTEVSRAAELGRSQSNGRGYCEADQPLLLALGIGALVASNLVFVLYLTQEAFLATRLASPVLLWGFPPIVFLLGGRIWLLSGRGELDDDPVAFAIKDRASLSLMGLTALLVSIAWIGLPF